jgi:hypothetical protein
MGKHLADRHAQRPLHALDAPAAENAFLGSWVWLFPAAYLVHIAEEFWSPPTFYVWVSRLVGIPFTAPLFLVANSLFMGLMLVAVLAVLRGAWPCWVVLTLATVVALNGLLHLLGTALWRSSSPGLWSGLFLYLPLGGVALARGARLLGTRAVRRGISTGVSVHALVPLVALLLSRSLRI